MQKNHYVYRKFSTEFDAQNCIRYYLYEMLWIYCVFVYNVNLLPIILNFIQ